MRRALLMPLAVALACLVGCSCSRTGGDVAVTPPAEASPEQQAIESAQSSVELIKARDYAASYAVLSPLDQAKVTQEEWVRRCQEVEAVAGQVETYRVIGSTWLDTDHAIRAVHVEIDFSGMDEPYRTTLFYEMKDGIPIQTMLWGRSIQLAGDAQ